MFLQGWNSEESFREDAVEKFSSFCALAYSHMLLSDGVWTPQAGVNNLMAGHFPFIPHQQHTHAHMHTLPMLPHCLWLLIRHHFNRNTGDDGCRNPLLCADEHTPCPGPQNCICCKEKSLPPSSLFAPSSHLAVRWLSSSPSEPEGKEKSSVWGQTDRQTEPVWPSSCFC